MGSALDPAALLVLACVQCALIAYGAITVIVPLLKLRAARKRAQQAVPEALSQEGQQPEAQPHPA